MKFTVLKMGLVACVAAMLVACGGGSNNNGSVAGGSTPPAPDPSLQVGGTAAIGTALAGAAIEVKCATGTGSATAAGSGAYTVSIARGVLPCVVRATGAGALSSIVLHSVVEAGNTDAATAVTTAKANVTPVTELVVAQLVADQPVHFFTEFATVSGRITQANLASALNAALAALKTAGLDLGSIDPLKSDLVAASGSSPGNAYDAALEQLGKKVPVDALPMLVAQVASAAASGSSAGLADAMAAVQGGALPGCSYVLSGNFRAIDYFGRMTLRPIDFSAMTFGADDGINKMSITQDATNPCAFTAILNLNGQVGEWQVAFGPGGAGIYRARIAAPTASAGVVGYIFPVQQHKYPELAGAWTFLQSGVFASEGVQHARGQMTFADARTASSCDYASASGWACVPDTSTLAVSDRSDGGFDLTEGSVAVGSLYAYQAPGGALTLFGTTNPTGATAAAVEQTSMVMAKIAPYTLPAVGQATRYSETLILFDFSRNRSTNPITSDEVRITEVDAATSTYKRSRVRDGRPDTWHLNTPVSGMRSRDADQTVGLSAAYQISPPGLGITVTTNADGAPGRFYSMSAFRP